MRFVEAVEMDKAPFAPFRESIPLGCALPRRDFDCEIFESTLVLRPSALCGDAGHEAAILVRDQYRMDLVG
jgi:hypothetical protein